MTFRRLHGILLFSALLQPTLGNPWCNPGTQIYCDTSFKQLYDLSCGWCRSWTFASNIVGNKLRMVGLDGGALPGDGVPSRDYMVEADLRKPFNLTDGRNWKLSLLPSHYPKLKGSVLWSDQSNSKIFSYGGQTLGTFAPTGRGLLTLDTESNQWYIDSNIVSPQLLTTGTSINAPNIGKAFYIGGYQSFETNHAEEDSLRHYATSMIQFDTESEIFIEKDAPFLPVQFGAVSHIQAAGGNDLLIYFGGESPPSQEVRSSSNFTTNSWDFVWIYDIEGDNWYRQQTSGRVTPRSQFCKTTIYDSDTDSWQIWVIGGVDLRYKTVVDTVSILSIPSFQWFDAGPAETRMATSCERVGSQIFVIGGKQAVDEEFNSGGDDYPAIAFIYDVNKQAAVRTFKPTSTSYVAPESVRASIATASIPAIWADLAIQRFFTARMSKGNTDKHFP